MGETLRDCQAVPGRCAFPEGASLIYPSRCANRCRTAGKRGQRGPWYLSCVSRVRWRALLALFCFSAFLLFYFSAALSKKPIFFYMLADPPFELFTPSLFSLAAPCSFGSSFRPNLHFASSSSSIDFLCLTRGRTFPYVPTTHLFLSLFLVSPSPRPSPSLSAPFYTRLFIAPSLWHNSGPSFLFSDRKALGD